MIQLGRWVQELDVLLKRICGRGRSLHIAALHSIACIARQPHWFWSSLFLVAFWLSVLLHGLNPAEAASRQLPLATNGAQILAASGQTVLPHGSPPVATRSPRSDPIVPSSTASQLQVQATMQSDWQTGFCTAIRVTNRGDTSSRNWRLKFQMNQATIRNSWNGIFSQHGARYTVEPPEWGQVIEPNQAVDLGFCAAKRGTDYRLQKLAVSSP